MSKSGFAVGRGGKQTVPDKVDMSLDDIIRMNKKEQQSRKRQAPGKRRPVMKMGRLAQANSSNVASRNGGPFQRGGGVLRGGISKLRSKRFLPQVGRRRGQGVVTGLAARRPASLKKGLNPINRTTYTQRTGQRTRPFIQQNEFQYSRAESQRRPYRPVDTQRSQNTAAPGRRPFQLRRRPLPPVHQAQRDARQATFLSRRGLKVQAHVHKQNLHSTPVKTQQWRNSPKNNGILTISIDNPTARTQPEPPTSWSLHPQPASSAPVKMETVERKAPKGVPLQFDINSVAKPQTAMTLNERFRILKDQRAATQNNKGGRFVTVN